jgi:hypothetical protein
LRDTGGTGFWHEAYFMRGGMEAIYDDISKPLKFSASPPVEEARRDMDAARMRTGVAGAPAEPPPVEESALYGPRND